MSHERLGPSADYVALLRGEIEADEYVRRLRRDVDNRLGIALAVSEAARRHRRGRPISFSWPRWRW